jgi:hypothetical protein
MIGVGFQTSSTQGVKRLMPFGIEYSMVRVVDPPRRIATAGGVALQALTHTLHYQGMTLLSLIGPLI